MNAEQLQQLVARAETGEEDARPPVGLLERARRDARRRRRLLVGGVVMVAAAASVAGVAVIPGWLEDGAEPPSAVDPGVASSTAPAVVTTDELRVTCTPTGPKVSTTTVKARSNGVRLVVDSTAPVGTYLTYESAGPSGGDPANQASASYAFPPGQVEIGCATPPEMDATGVVAISVVDSQGFWRDGTPQDFGCGPGAITDWVVGPVLGDSEEQAAQGVLDAFAAETGRRYTAAPASIGYIDSDTQTWIAYDDSRNPKITVLVTRTGTGYSAGLDSPCGRP